MRLSRRTFLGSAATFGALLGAARLGLSHKGDAHRRFLFLHAEGGWDPLCVFAPMFDSDEIEMEPDAEPWTIGDHRLVDSPQRPTVRTFFERWHDRVAIVDGVSTRSVNHETCQAVALTGSTSEDGTDWATILGERARADHSLPHLVLSGPSFAGPYSVFVSHAQGLLQPTIDGTLLAIGDTPIQMPDAAAGRVVDRFLEMRGRELQERHPELRHAADYREALARARTLVDGRLELQLVSGDDLLGRARTAISALAAGVCRCASVGTDFVWDTHPDNSLQSGLFEGFFGALDRILDELAATPGPSGAMLADETIVIVTSEMARTPAYNETGGRDHWPYTSMLALGPGVAGGRALGGYTRLYTGIGVDAGGERDPSAPSITAESLGASLLVLGGVDPQELLPGAQPIPGLVA